MLRKIYGALRDIKLYGPVNCGKGICDNVVVLVDRRMIYNDYIECMDIIKKYYMQWPLFDNKNDPDNDYPVEGSLREYMRSINNGDVWDKTKEAGKRRYELLDFLIEKIGEDLGNV